MLSNVRSKAPDRLRDRVTSELRNGLGRALSEGLSIRPGEGARTGLLFALLLLSSAVFVMGRTVRDTLFLSRYSISALPWMFVAYGVASAITVVVYSRVSDKSARHRVIVGWSVLGILSYLGTWGLVQVEATWVYPVFYVWSEVFANLLISQFWTLANELCDARVAKRLFPTIGSARVLGVIVVGLLTGAIVRLIGTAQLLFVLCGLLAIVSGIALRLGKEAKPKAQAPSARPHKYQRPPPSSLRDPYLWALSMMLLSAFAALTIGDYQFKAIARATYKEDALAAFFSFFYAGTGIISFFFQMFATPRLLSRFGVSMGMSVMPALFGGACALLLGIPSLAIATVMKFADNGFQYTIHDTTMQVLYVPFAAEVKVRARAFLDAVVKPIAYGLGGLLLVAFATRLGPERLAFVSVGLVFVWLFSIPLVKRRYMQKLASTLRAGGFATLSDEPITDAGRRGVLLSALSSDDPHLALAALEELSEVDGAALEALERLAKHPEATIRVIALRRLAELSEGRTVPVSAEGLTQALHDPTPEVRAAAVTALAALKRDEAVEPLSPWLHDPAPSVRSAALSGLLRHAGFEGAMVAGSQLALLLDSRQVEDRIAAAQALGAIGPSATRRLSILLSDADERVQVAALRAAAQVGDARLIPRLLSALEHQGTQRHAQAALVSTGAAAVEALGKLLIDVEAPRGVRLAIPRVLRQIPTPESYVTLRAGSDTRDGQVRLRVFSALSRVRERLGQAPESLEAIEAWIQREIRESVTLSASYAAVRDEIGTPLLDDAIAFSSERGGRRILRILELRSTPQPLRLVRAKIDDPSRRANALEVLDSSLDPGLRPLVMPFFDDTSPSQKALRCGITSLKEKDALLEEHLSSANPYTLVAALDAVRSHLLRPPTTKLETLLSHPDPAVREGAILALSALEPSRISALCAQCSHDPAPQILRVCHALLHPEVHVYTTVEKLLMLRAAPMFSKIRSEDLLPLAQVAEVEPYRAGEMIFATGDTGDALFVVARGNVAISHSGKLLANMARGEAFGEMSVLDAEPRSADAVAVEDTELLRIGREEFYEVMREQVEIAEGVIHVLSGRLREANKRLELQRGD